MRRGRPLRGVSSMMISTPVRLSRARMFRPSLPMMRPFMSSDGSSTTETVVSAAWLAATRWRASATRLRARRFASMRASSSSCLTCRASSWRISSSERRSRCCFASSTVMPAMCWSSATSRSRTCLSSSCSSLTCVSRSATPWSRRSTSVIRCCSSSSRACARSSDLAHTGAVVVQLTLDLGAQPHGFLTGGDLRLAPGRLCLALGLVEQQLAVPLRLTHRGRSQQPDRHHSRDRSHYQPDQDSDGDEHELRSCLVRRAPEIGCPRLEPWRCPSVI